MPLSKPRYPPLNSGSTQEDRKHLDTSKTVEKDVLHQQKRIICRDQTRIIVLNILEPIIPQWCMTRPMCSALQFRTVISDMNYDLNLPFGF